MIADINIYIYIINIYIYILSIYIYISIYINIYQYIYIYIYHSIRMMVKNLGPSYKNVQNSMKSLALDGISIHSHSLTRSPSGPWPRPSAWPQPWPWRSIHCQWKRWKHWPPRCATQTFTVCDMGYIYNGIYKWFNGIYSGLMGFYSDSMGYWLLMGYTPWWTNIAMENGHKK